MAAPASCLPARRASVEAAPPGGRAALRAVPALPAAAAAETTAGSRQLPRWVAWFPCRGLPHRQSQLGRAQAAVCMCSQRVPQQPASCGICVRNFQALMVRCPHSSCANQAWTWSLRAAFCPNAELKRGEEFWRADAGASASPGLFVVLGGVVRRRLQSPDGDDVKVGRLLVMSRCFSCSKMLQQAACWPAHVP